MNVEDGAMSLRRFESCFRRLHEKPSEETVRFILREESGIWEDTSNFLTKILHNRNISSEKPNMEP